VRGEKSWAADFQFAPTTQWVQITPATLSFVSEGGPLMISVDLSLLGLGGAASYFSCRPMIDGQWAGSYGNYPYSAEWTEGLNFTSGGWRAWAKTRVYRGVPAGAHVLTIECIKDTTAVMRVGYDTVPQSVSVVEMN